MTRSLYTILYYLALPFIMLRLCYRGLKAPRYWQRIPERFGFFQAPDAKPFIWVHSVSVGETIAAIPIIKHLQETYPQHRIVVTTMTPTGSERVRSVFGDSVFHVYAPYDLPGSIQRFLNKVQPQLLLIMETELWPNIIHYSHKAGVPVLLANARLSERSAKGYGKISGLTQTMLSELSMVAAQHQTDAGRFQALGLPTERVEVTGSIKLDISLDEITKEQAASLKARLSNDGKRFIWIAASTHEGEDELLLKVHQRLLQEQPDALLILVPRHPERFGKVAQQCESQFKTVKRSQAANAVEDTQVLLGDTMGELLLLYGCADVAFVGGSLVEHGGHNMLEPAAWGLPILTGRHNFNFEKIAAALEQVGGMKTVPGSEQLADEVMALASSATHRTAMGAAARSYMASNRGALQKLLALIDQQLKS